jgi:hypothetical protein
MTLKLENTSLPEAYCPRCGVKKTMKDVSLVTLLDGKTPALKGRCPYCHAIMFHTGRES